MRQLIFKILFVHFLLCPSLTFSQTRVSIQGLADSKEMAEAAQIYLEQLGVKDDLHVTVNFSPDMPANLKGITLPPVQVNHANTQFFRIMINSNVSHRERLKVLAHEMIHVKQYATKELIVLDYADILWQGKKFGYSRNHNRRAPWEIEAYGNERQLEKLGQTALLAKEEQQANDLSGTFICMEEKIRVPLLLSID